MTTVVNVTAALSGEQLMTLRRHLRLQCARITGRRWTATTTYGLSVDLRVSGWNISTHGTRWPQVTQHANRASSSQFYTVHLSIPRCLHEYLNGLAFLHCHVWSCACHCSVCCIGRLYRFRSVMPENYCRCYFYGELTYMIALIHLHL